MEKIYGKLSNLSSFKKIAGDSTNGQSVNILRVSIEAEEHVSTKEIEAGIKKQFPECEIQAIEAGYHPQSTQGFNFWCEANFHWVGDCGLCSGKSKNIEIELC